MEAHEVPGKALVADADRFSRAGIAAILARLGCETVQAATAAQALQLARADEPVLAVLDVDLPELSGYEVCRQLRDAFGEGLPIVFVSATRTEPADEVAGLLLGADAYMAKPVREDLFLARVRRLLALSRARLTHRGKLTPREREVLALLVRGVVPAEIARDLCITTKTTATHIEHILTKLGAHSQAQAVAFAIRDHVVDNAA